jgi:hypothetical protein
MSVILGLATVPSSSTVTVFTLPAGLCNFFVFQPTPATATVYLGTSPGVAATNGMPVPVTPLQEETYVAGKGVTYYATTGNATASSFCYLISTAF